jgi:putative transposase
MPRPLSNDLRERIVRVVDGGMSRNAAAQKYDVSISAVVKLIQRWRTTGSYLPGQMGGWRKHRLAEHSDKVNKLLTDKPDITVAEMQKRLATMRIKVSQSAITRFLIHVGHSYKKNRTRQRARST